MTKANIAKWTEGLRVKNKENKRMGLPKWTFEQYVDYCHGIQPKVDPRSREVLKPKVRLCGTRTCKANERTC